MVKGPRSTAASKKPAAAPSTASPKRATASKSTTQKTGKTVSDGTAAKRGPRTAARATPPRTSTPAKASRATPKRSEPVQRTPAQASAAATPSTLQLGYLSGFVGFHLRLAQDASYRAFARIKDKDLVRPGRFPALAIIHLNPGISQSALGRAISRDKSTVSPLIKDLQKNGLITRKPSPTDRRSVTLVLTKKGTRVLDRLHARALEHEEDLDKLVGASKARLVTMLDKITSGLAEI